MTWKEKSLDQTFADAMKVWHVFDGLEFPGWDDEGLALLDRSLDLLTRWRRDGRNEADLEYAAKLVVEDVGLVIKGFGSYSGYSLSRAKENRKREDLAMAESLAGARKAAVAARKLSDKAKVSKELAKARLAEAETKSKETRAECEKVMATHPGVDSPSEAAHSWNDRWERVITERNKVEIEKVHAEIDGQRANNAAKEAHKAWAAAHAALKLLAGQESKGNYGMGPRDIWQMIEKRDLIMSRLEEFIDPPVVDPRQARFQRRLEKSKKRRPAEKAYEVNDPRR